MFVASAAQLMPTNCCATFCDAHRGAQDCPSCDSMAFGILREH
jgi:hypothetical protein